MAREAYRSLYGDLTKLKDTSLLNDPAGGTADDDELFQLLLAASVLTEDHCNRHFYTLTTTRRFDGPGGATLLVPDLISVTTLKSDDDDDGTYEATWATTDYQLLPLNANPTEHWGSPYQVLRALKRGTKQQFAVGQARFEVVGLWGYRNHVEPSGSSTTGTVTSSAGSLTVTASSDFAIGQTIVVDSEQMLVITNSGGTLGVKRGLNGTVAASHANAVAVSIQRWPAPVERATLINAARIWTRAPAFEPFYVDADLDSDVRQLLDAYRLAPGAV